ncbi:MAG: peptidylprolyl isomerase [Alphaproteobacteria bacterium]|nr:peptidylprolyl isomerase [Alphaproteobacteria bacterium]
MFKPNKKAGLAAVAIMAMSMMALPAMAMAKVNPADEIVVATVNGDKIFKKDVLGALKSLPVPSADTEKVFPVVVDQMINEKLIDVETAKAEIEKSPEFQQRFAAMKAQLVKTVYLEKYLKDKITAKTVKAEYDKFKKENKGKEEVHARHIVVPSEEEAKKIIKELDGGAKFADLAKEKSSGPTAKNGGDVGFFAKGEIIPEFSDAAFKLKVGSYTKEPVKSQFGWHVIFVEEKRERAVPDLKDVEAAIRNKLGQGAIESLVKGLRAKADIKHFSMDGKPLEETKKN